MYKTLKNKNKVVLIIALLAAGGLLFSYASHTYKRVVHNVTCSEAGAEEKIIQSDVPLLESLTRHFLILHY